MNPASCYGHTGLTLTNPAFCSNAIGLRYPIFEHRRFRFGSGQCNRARWVYLVCHSFGLEDSHHFDATNFAAIGHPSLEPLSRKLATLPD